MLPLATLYCVSEHGKWIRWQGKGLGNVAYLIEYLVTRYSLMVKFTEPEGMIVIPTRFDRVTTFYYSYFPIVCVSSH